MKLLRLFSLIFCLVFAKGYADFGPGCGPCGPQDCCCPQECCCFEFGTEWLYMLSSIDQPFFVQEASLSGGDHPFGKRFANEQRWHSGYRLEARYFLPCGCGDYVRARWTHFPCFENRRTIDFPEDDIELRDILLHPTDAIVGFGSASIKNRFHYYNLEVLWGRPVYCCCGLKLDLEFGVQWSKIDFHERALYLSVTDADVAFLSNKSKFCGFGPEIILDFAYCFTPCFSIKGRSAFAFLVNRREAHFDEVFIESSADIDVFKADNDKYWYGTPYFNTRVGVSYQNCLSFCGWDNWRFELEVGYEFIHLIKAVDRIYFVDDADEGSSFVQHQDFTLHGPFVHLGLCF